jgi:hypothetical protein
MSPDTVKDVWTIQQVTEILTDAGEIEQRLADARWRTYLLGHPVPLRTGLGHWEQMRLDQARVVREALSAVTA